MNGNIVGEEFQDYVFSQIGLRQEIHGRKNRSPEELQYLSNNNSWVKLASPVFIEKEGTKRLSKIMENETEAKKFSGIELAKNSILFNGLSSLKEKSYEQRAGIVKNNSKLWNNAAYGLGGTDFGLQPFPQISDISIQCLNRGSIRRAEVNIIAYNQFQFEILELLYLRLGFTVMLEWGNNKFFEVRKNALSLNSVGNTLIEEIWFQENGLSQLDVLKEINFYREKYQGNYDAFFGKVSNFSFNFNEDGSYSITLSLITIGDVIESITANVPVKSFFRLNNLKNKLDEKTEESLKESPLVTAASNNVFNAWMYTCIKDKELWSNNEGSRNEYLNFHDHVRKEKADIEKTDNKSYETINIDKLDPKYAYYVTFSELLKKVEEYVIPNIIIKEGPNACLEIHRSIDNNYVNYFPNQISFDPRICLIKPTLGGGDIGELEVPKYFNNLLEYVGVVNNVAVGQLMNIYLNFDFISSCIGTAAINDKITLYKFLENICNGINKALGGVNKIEPVLDDDNTIKFIDQTPIPGLIPEKPKSDIVDLEIFGYNNSNNSSNFVRNIEFVTKITPALATQITIGATAATGSVKNEDATAFSKWNKGLKDRFAGKYVIPEPKVDPTSPEDDERRWNADAKSEWEGFEWANDTVVDYSNFSQKSGTYYRKSVQSTTHKIVPKDSIIYAELGRIKRITLEEYQTKYVNKKRNQSLQGLIEEHDYDKIAKTNYAFYLSECFGGDVSYQVALDKTAESKVFVPSAGGALGGITSRISSFVASKLAPRRETKTMGGNGFHRYIQYDSSFINRSSNVYESYLNTFYNQHYQDTGTPSPLIGFIPVTFNIELDGISGIKIYNKLNVSQRFLPKQYPEALKFIVTKVDHRVQNNEWTTQLETISIPNVDPNDYRQIWQKVQLNASDLQILLPVEQRGPKPKGDKLIVLDNRNTVPGVTTIPEISVDELLKDFHPQARPSFTSFFKELESNYKGYTILVNSLQRDFTASDLLSEVNPANAAGGSSRHNYNTAIDFNVTTPTGERLKKSTGKKLWINHGFDTLAKKYNIKWGGTFDNYKDYVHFAWQDYSLEKAFLSHSNQLGTLGEVDTNKIKLEV